MLQDEVVGFGAESHRVEHDILDFRHSSEGELSPVADGGSERSPTA